MRQYKRHHIDKSKQCAKSQFLLVEKLKNQYEKVHTQFYEESICQDIVRYYFL